MSNSKLPVVAGALADDYSEMAIMNLSMEFYEFYEKFFDMQINYIENGRNIVTTIAKAVSNIFTGEESDEEVMTKLFETRNEIIDRTEAIQSCADYLRIHEYLLNRIELSFTDDLKEVDNDEEARKILQFLFESEDNTVVNLRIQEMVAQMPVRITSNRFFDLLKESFSVYKGAERETLKGFVYLILSAAGISEAGKNSYFPDLEKYRKDFAEIDYKSLTEAEFNEYEDELSAASLSLSQRSEFCLSAVKVINGLYTYYLLKNYTTKPVKALEDVKSCLKVVSVNFLREQEVPGEFAEIPVEFADEAFTKLEGDPEKISMRISSLEGKIESEKDNILAADPEAYQALTDAGILMSTSDFARIDEGIDVTKCTDEIINETFEGVAAQIKAAFDEGGKKVRRAIMASVLKELPVFFVSRTEVMNYLRFTLDNCGDNAEKTASINLFWDAVK